MRKKFRELEHLALHLRCILWYRRSEAVGHWDSVPCIDGSDGCGERCELAFREFFACILVTLVRYAIGRYASQRFGPRECGSFSRGEDVGFVPHGDEAELNLGEVELARR